MKAIVCGANGAMGKLICDRLDKPYLVSLDGENGVAPTFDALGKVDADVIIDFSHHSAISDVIAYARDNHMAVVIGATGHTEEEKALIYAASQEIPVFFSGNMSMGIAVLKDLVQQAVALFPDADVEIVETHHNRKADAPSGTAKMLFASVKAARENAVAVYGRSGEGKRGKNDVGISALRMGNVVGIHEVHICTPSQSITLRHEAFDRGMFADGAVAAAQFVCGKDAGLYDMKHLLEAGV